MVIIVYNFMATTRGSRMVVQGITMKSGEHSHEERCHKWKTTMIS